MTLQNPLEQSPIPKNFQEHSLFPENSRGNHEDRDSISEFGRGLETFFQDHSGVEELTDPNNNMIGKYPQGGNLYTLDPAAQGGESRVEKPSEMPPPYERAECRNRPVFDPPMTDPGWNTDSLEVHEWGQEVTKKKRFFWSSWFSSCSVNTLLLVMILALMVAPSVVIYAIIAYIKRKH